MRSPHLLPFMTLVREYQKERARQYGGKAYRLVESPAEGALSMARARIRFRENWTLADGGDNGDVYAVSDSGQYRIRILPDEHVTLDDLLGDCFDPKCCPDVPGGKRTIEAEKKREIERIERDGVWGYVIEKLIPPCTQCGAKARWERVDSCWGYVGNDWEDEVILVAYRLGC